MHHAHLSTADLQFGPAVACAHRAPAPRPDPRRRTWRAAFASSALSPLCSQARLRLAITPDTSSGPDQTAPMVADLLLRACGAGQRDTETVLRPVITNHGQHPLPRDRAAGAGHEPKRPPSPLASFPATPSPATADPAAARQDLTHRRPAAAGAALVPTRPGPIAGADTQRVQDPVHREATVDGRPAATTSGPIRVHRRASAFICVKPSLAAKRDKTATPASGPAVRARKESKNADLGRCEPMHADGPRRADRCQKPLHRGAAPASSLAGQAGANRDTGNVLPPETVEPPPTAAMGAMPSPARTAAATSLPASSGHPKPPASTKPRRTNTHAAEPALRHHAQDPMHREPAPAALRTGPLRNGNPRGNPNLAPRCGARTRLGCPCLAPALRGKLRCRMHGGGSTGPRTAEGMQRLRAARTIHGACSAEAHLHHRAVVSLRRRSQVLLDAAALRGPPAAAIRRAAAYRRAGVAGAALSGTARAHPVAGPDSAKPPARRQKPLHRGSSPSQRPGRARSARPHRAAAAEATTPRCPEAACDGVEGAPVGFECLLGKSRNEAVGEPGILQDGDQRETRRIRRHRQHPVRHWAGPAASDAGGSRRQRDWGTGRTDTA